MKPIRFATFLVLTICLCPAIGLFGQDTTTVTYQGPVYIPDDPADLTIFLPVFVNRALEITDVEVTVNVDHPNIGDLELTLINPTGKTRRLADEECDEVRDMTNVTFDTDAPQEYGDACPPGATILRPHEGIDDWDDDISIGLWYLQVKDDSDGNTGFVLDYTLRITGNRWPQPVFTSESVLDAANLNRGAVTPGELVWIVGANLGPADPVWAAIDPVTGLVPTELEGSSVSFGGVAAPILFTSLRVIRVQVPTTLEGYSTVAQVGFQGLQTSEVTLNLVPASLGLYTVSGTGSGQVSAINQDGTVNSRDNAAERDSVVLLYANGLGPVDPPVPTGQAAPVGGPLSIAVFPVRASVGGLEAPVYFAGLAPGTVGTFQVNVGIPSDAPTGNDVPISITSNSASSQVASISLK